MSGGNAELIARLRISKAQARELEKVLIERSQDFEALPKDPEAIASEAVLEELQSMRRQLATELNLVWSFGLGGASLHAAPKPPTIATGTRLDVAPFARPELVCPWPPGVTEVLFGGLLPADQGEFVILSLCDISSGVTISWSQKAAIDSDHQGILDRRDDALAAELLTLQDLIRLIQAELAGKPHSRGVPWHVHRPPSTRRGFECESFTDLQLEDLLRSGARNPEWSQQVLSRVEGTLNKLLENPSEERVSEIETFLRIWRPFMAAFGGGS